MAPPHKKRVTKLYQSLTRTPKIGLGELNMASILVIQKFYQPSFISSKHLFIPKEIKSVSLSWPLKLRRWIGLGESRPTPLSIRNMHEVSSNIEIFTMPKPKFTKDDQPMLVHAQYYLRDKF